jgi:hypothetical protein
VTATPPNLRALFGHRLRVGHDPAAETAAERNNPWMMQMACRGQGVTIYPHGEGTLAVQCDNRRFLAKQLAELGLAIHQDGDTEKTFLFPVARFEEVAKIVKPLRRPALTPSQRADRAARMKARNASKIGPFEGNAASRPPKVA